MLLRIALYGFSLLFLCTTAFMTVYLTMVQPGLERERIGRLTRAMDAAFESRQMPVVLAAQTRALHHEPFIRMSVYAADGSLLLTNEDPPLAPAHADEIARMRATNEAQPMNTEGRMMVGAYDGSAYLGYAVYVWRSPPFRTNATFLALAAMLGVLAIFSFVFARRLAAPLEELSDAVNAFGAGDTAARVRSTRNDELGDLARSFDGMADRVAGMLKTERELLANVSHELRTPIARMRTVLEIIEEGDAARARRGMVEIAEDLGELERLVADVLMAARLDLAAGRTPKDLPPLRTERIDAHSIAEQAVARLRVQDPKRTVVLTESTSKALVEADRALLRRAMDNLLDNARKYSPTTTAIDVSLREQDGQVAFEVADRGMGITESDRAQLFTPFFRGDKSRSRAAGGVGLGLVLTRRIVEAHQGTIEIRPRDGGGTVAAFQIPSAHSLSA
ncbi:MAG: HAMP domain-containing histidine kinase [Sandaracinaceae bacterium]|nr:HAMP domain-containing histidine kinase [Sandaracinaceae bacterium]